MRWIIVACFVFLSAAGAARAQTDAEVEAFRKGYDSGKAAGRAECQADPGCARIVVVGGGGTGIGDSGAGSIGYIPPGAWGFPWDAGSSAAYELPETYLGGGEAKVTIPKDWPILPLGDGKGIAGKVEMDGSFSPFVYRADGSYGPLSPYERPAWTEDPAFGAAIANFPKLEGGVTMVPVQPAPDAFDG